LAALAIDCRDGHLQSAFVRKITKSEYAFGVCFDVLICICALTTVKHSYLTTRFSCIWTLADKATEKDRNQPRHVGMESAYCIMICFRQLHQSTINSHVRKGYLSDITPAQRAPKVKASRSFA
jgi:hypothetical protein